MEFVKTLRQYPEIATFLALAIGVWFGNLKFGKLSLGVTFGAGIDSHEMPGGSAKTFYRILGPNQPLRFYET